MDVLIYKEPFNKEVLPELPDTVDYRGDSYS